MRKFLLILFILLFAPCVAVFAEDDDTDIYEDNTPTQSATNYSNNSTPKKQETGRIESFPKFEGYLLSEYYLDILDNGKERIQKGENITNWYLNLEALMRLRITKGFFLETKWFLQPVNRRRYTGSIYAKNPDYIVGDALNSDFYGKENHVKRGFQFSSYGLGIETLQFGYKNKNLALGLGKINPSFGSAFDKARFSGIYGVYMPEEYELTEKIGAYISALLPFGNLTFNVFFDDTTGMSATMFKNRGRDKSKGGAGNTDVPNNFSITFDGKFENLSFNIGYRYLSVDLKQESVEQGFVAGAEYLFEWDYGINFLPYMEIAYLNNFDGMRNRDVTYWTTFLPVIIENWHFIFSNTTKFDIEKGYHSYTSYLTQLSFGYKFDFGLMLDLSKIWERRVKKASGFLDIPAGKKWVQHQDSWSFMVSYLFKF